MTAVFLLCTIILFVLQTLSMKLQHAEHLPQKLLVNCAFSLLAAAAMGAGRLAVPDMFTVSPATLRHGIAFGVLFALTILFYNLAIASGPLSYTTFYFSASMLVPAFAGVLLFGEALTFTLAAAVALFLAAFWCLNVAPGGAQKPEPRWLALCALTFLCNGLCAVVQKSQQNATGGAEAAGLMLVGFCTAAACYALAYLALRGRLPAGAADGTALLRQNALAAVLLAGGSVGGNLLLTWLAGRVDASYLFPLVQGSIIVGGMEVSQIDPEKLMSLYSIVFQDVTLFDNTILENIRLGRKGATDEEVLAAAKLANCEEFAEKLPDKWNTNIGENGCTLSGGERQRISIARAFLKDAPIILLDEATASLDVENETAIQEALSRLIKNKTVLIIAHRMRTVAGADKVVVLKDGIVAEQGRPDELYARNGLYAHMVDLQSASQNWTI